MKEVGLPCADGPQPFPDDKLFRKSTPTELLDVMHDYPAHHPLPPSAVTAAREALTCYVTGMFSQLSREVIE